MFMMLYITAEGVGSSMSQSNQIHTCYGWNHFRICLTFWFQSSLSSLLLSLCTYSKVRAFGFQHFYFFFLYRIFKRVRTASQREGSSFSNFQNLSDPPSETSAQRGNMNLSYKTLTVHSWDVGRSAVNEDVVNWHDMAWWEINSIVPPHSVWGEWLKGKHWGSRNWCLLFFCGKKSICWALRNNHSQGHSTRFHSCINIRW